MKMILHKFISCHFNSWHPIIVQKLFVHVVHFYPFHFQQNAVNALVVAIFFKPGVFGRRGAGTVGYDLRVLRVMQPFPNKRHGCRAFS